MVESFSPPSCSADGGEELLISGFNISAQSRAVFMEKGPGEGTLPRTSSRQGSVPRPADVLFVSSDGRSLWEAEARVVPEKSGAVRSSITKHHGNMCVH